MREVNQVNRRTFLKGTAATTLGVTGLASLLAACSDDGQPAAGGAGKATKVRFQIDFLPLGRFSPFYYAKEQGLYQRRNLDVEISTSSGSGPTLQQLAAGNVDVISNPMSQVLRLMGKTPDPLMRSYAVMFTKSVQTIFFFKGGPISEPKDLERRTIATSAGSNEFLLFPRFAKANGIDAGKVQWKVVDAAAKTGLLLQGAVDATSTTIFGLSGLQAGAKPGQEIGTFIYGDYGVKEQGASLVTTDRFATANPEALKSFVQATMEGFTQALENPEAAVAAMLKVVPTLKREVALGEMKLLPDIVLGPVQKEKGIGWQDPELVKATYDAIVAEGQPISRPYTDFFSNDLLGAS